MEERKYWLSTIGLVLALLLLFLLASIEMERGEEFDPLKELREGELQSQNQGLDTGLGNEIGGFEVLGLSQNVGPVVGGNEVYIEGINLPQDLVVGWGDEIVKTVLVSPDGTRAILTVPEATSSMSVEVWVLSQRGGQKKIEEGYEYK